MLEVEQQESTHEKSFLKKAKARRHPFTDESTSNLYINTMSAKKVLLGLSLNLKYFFQTVILIRAPIVDIIKGRSPSEALHLSGA